MNTHSDLYVKRRLSISSDFLVHFSFLLSNRLCSDASGDARCDFVHLMNVYIKHNIKSHHDALDA